MLSGFLYHLVFFESLEMETRKPLRSLNSDSATYVDFVNKSRGHANAWWLDFSGNPVSYGDIQPNGTLKMDTYLTHPWIFRATENGAVLAANQQEVYYPTLTEYPEYITVNITTPVYSLHECCLMVIRRLVKGKDLHKLDIPESLKHDLLKSPNLSKELEILNSNAP